GVRRALVTDGQDPAVFAAEDGMVERRPAMLAPVHVTGAGDALMAAHIAAERAGAEPAAALAAALDAAARHVGGRIAR
ncbi:MAG: PfkB family carbohydrate kinase, partial [Rhodovulum sp.]